MICNALKLATPLMAIAVAAVAICGAADSARAQLGGWSTPPHAAIPPGVTGTLVQPPIQAMAETAPFERRGALARLIRNPEITDGLPPFALTDRGGTIQRYVEPVGGIQLEPYIDQVVIVRHDTGRTLLASQLELPPRPLLPMLTDNDTAGERSTSRHASAALGSHLGHDSRTRLAQFADDDDSTVELLPEAESQPEAAGPEQNNPPEQSSDTAPGEEIPPVSDDVVSPMLESEDGPLREAPLVDPEIMSPDAEAWDYMEPCPECGGFHHTLECNPHFGAPYGQPRSREKPSTSRLFVDFELNFLRTHLNENAIGKLSEKYEFSPRVTVGFRETGKLDGRARYWHYERDTPVLGGSPLTVEFDVLDLEGTHLFLGRRSELVLAGGLRLAAINLTDNDDDAVGADLLGITFAADGRTRLCEFESGLFTWVYGGRLSILGGDWGGDPGSDFVTILTQDDNVSVHELHAGIDYAICYRDFDLHTRLGFEIQNWRSDVLAQNSIGVLGPSILIGAEF